MLKFICVISVLACATSSVYASHGWKKIPGDLDTIGASVNNLWGTLSNKVYYCAQPCTGNWKQASGSVRQLDASDCGLWGTNTGNGIYVRPVDGTGNWKGISGAALHVSASGNGYIWYVSSNDYCSYSCKRPCSGKSTKMDTCALKQLDAGEEYVYAVNNSNHVLSCPVDGSRPWRVVPGRMQYVTVGPREIYGLDPQNELNRCVKPCIGEWEKIPFDACEDEGGLKQMEATLNGVFAVTTSGSIYHYKTEY